MHVSSYCYMCPHTAIQAARRLPIDFLIPTIPPQSPANTPAAAMEAAMARHAVAMSAERKVQVADARHIKKKNV